MLPFLRLRLSCTKFVDWLGLAGRAAIEQPGTCLIDLNVELPRGGADRSGDSTTRCYRDPLFRIVCFEAKSSLKRQPRVYDHSSIMDIATQRNAAPADSQYDLSILSNVEHSDRASLAANFRQR